MKLSKQQQRAIILKICDEIDESNLKKDQQKRKEFLESIDPKVKQIAEDYYDMCKSLDRGLSRQYTKEGFILSHFNFKTIHSPISYMKVENEYYLSTIECDNIEEIISKIKAKFL